MYILRDEIGNICATTFNTDAIVNWIRNPNYTVANVPKDSILKTLEDLCYRETGNANWEHLMIAYAVIKSMEEE